MDIETERGSEEQLFNAGYTEEKMEDEDDFGFGAEEPADDFAFDDFKDE